MILVSACLAKMRTRYDGTDRSRGDIVELVRSGRAVPVCPELLGGLGVPREPSVIVGGSGRDVIGQRAKVVAESGRDVTPMFITGARRTCSLARAVGARTAVLKSGSPSCGSGRQEDDGVTTALLRDMGIRIMTEEEYHRERGERGERGE